MIDNLQSASFRGVPFLIGNVSTRGGRKQATHEFPNTDRRTVEDLGRLNDSYTITGIVVTKDNFDDRDKLKEALSQSGNGELVHPYYGTVTVASRPFTITENTNTAGIATFNMVFDVAQEPIYPATTNVKSALIKSQSDEALGLIKGDMGGIFSVGRRLSSNYASALSQLNNVGDSFSGIKKLTSAVSGNLTKFTASIFGFRNSLNTNIFNPLALADSMSDMILNMDTVASSALGQFNLSSSLFSYGKDDPVVQQITPARIEKAKNQLIINSFMSASSISLAYNNAAQIPYINEPQVFEVRNLLEQEYQSIVSNNNLSGDTLAALQTLRDSTRLLFDDISVRVPKVVAVNVNELPMTIHAFNYYGNVEKTDDLIKLNDTNDVSFVSDKLEILTP